MTDSGTRRVGAVVLAAGGSRRFGEECKQLAPLQGRPLIEHAVAAAEGVEEISPIVVVLGAFASEITSCARFTRANPVLCDAWREGIASSLGTGIHALAEAGCESGVILLGDQPWIRPGAIRLVLDALEPDDMPAARAAYDGVPGHPVAVSSQIFAQLQDLQGDNGARALLTQIGTRSVECSQICSNADIDTQVDLERNQRSDSAVS